MVKLYEMEVLWNVSQKQANNAVETLENTTNCIEVKIWSTNAHAYLQ